MDNKDKKVYVLVYGSLREKMGNHRLIERVGKKLIDNNIIINGYEMKSLGAYPGILKGDNKILCEMYETTQELIESSFDYLEGYIKDNPKKSFYLRTEINLPKEIIDNDLIINKAYIYELNEEEESEYKSNYRKLENVPFNKDGIQDWVNYKLSK